MEKRDNHDIYSCRCLVINPEGKILLLKKNASASWNAGKWGFPGGKRETHESFSETCLRELQKETGVIVAQNSFSREFCKSTRAIRDGKYAGKLHTVSFTLLEIREDEEIVLSEEHSDYKWASLDDLMLDSAVIQEDRDASIILHSFMMPSRH